MSRIRRFVGGIRALIRRRAAEQDLSDELGSFLEISVEEKVNAGMSRDEARRRALAEIGNRAVVRESVRDVGWESFAVSGWKDLRYALRMMARAPTFTAVAVLTLALGIGANTAIFQVLDAIVLKPLPVRGPEQLVRIQGYHGENPNGFSYPLLREMMARQSTLEGLFASGRIGIRELAIDGQNVSENVSAWLATARYFSLIGTSVQLGRYFTDADDDASKPPVAVISDRFWRRQFGASPSAVGRRIKVNGLLATVIGVTAPGFYGERVDDPADFWVPISFAADVESPGLLTPSAIWLQPMARLRADVPMARAEEELALFWDQMRELSLQFRGATDYDLELTPAYQGLGTLHLQYSRSLWLLMGLVLLVALVACCNLANLLLARATGRTREIGVRLALGASRLRVVRQLLTESLVIAAAGGLAGLLASGLVSRALMATAAAGEPWGVTTGVDWRAAGFTACATLAAALVFGLVPALTSTRSSLSATLQRATRATGTRRRRLAGNVFVVAQVGLSVVLVVCSVLFVRTFWNLVGQDYGFRPENLLVAQLASSRGVIDPQTRASVETRIGELPAVASAAMTSSGMLGQWPSLRPVAVSAGDRVLPESLGFRIMPVSPGLLETLGVPVLRGRAVEESDGAGRRIAVVSQAAARLLYGDSDPMGRAFTVGAGSSPENSFEIVGLSGDLKLYSLREPFVPVAFVPFAQFGPPGTPPTLAVRTLTAPASVIPELEEAVEAVDGNLRIEVVSPVANLIRESVRQERLLAWLAGGFGLLSVLLACGGLYGVAAYLAQGRTREIGIRLALGARIGGIRRMVVGELLTVICVGIVMGVLASLAVSRLVGGLLFGLSETDMFTIGAAAAVLLAASALASYLPAHRASSVDPIVALRSD